MDKQAGLSIIKTKKPTRGPVATKDIIGSIVEDLEALEKQAGDVKKEVRKVPISLKRERLIVIVNGRRRYKDIVSTDAGEVA